MVLSPPRQFPWKLGIALFIPVVELYLYFDFIVRRWTDEAKLIIAWATIPLKGSQKTLNVYIFFHTRTQYFLDLLFLCNSYFI